MNSKIEKYIFSWTELVSATSQEGCLLCTAIEEKLMDTYRKLLGEGIINRDCREETLHGLGFCQWHAHQLLTIEKQQFHEHYLMAIYYENLLSHILLYFQKAAALLDHPKRWKSALSAFLAAESSERILRNTFVSNCRVCQARATFEDFFISEFLRYLECVEFLEIYRRQSWLCLPHLIRVVEPPIPSVTLRFLVNQQQMQMAGIKDQLLAYRGKALTEELLPGECSCSPEVSAQLMRGKLF
jgi:hypothetical protein